MVLSQPGIAAAYKIIAEVPGEFTLEVKLPGAPLTKVWVCSANMTAEQWIADHKLKIAHGPVRRRYFTRAFSSPVAKSNPL
jgi:hypothetical protein